MTRTKRMFFTTFIVCLANAAAFAVPSVRQLGTSVSTSGANSSVNTEKPVAALPSLPKAGVEVVRSVKTQAGKETDDTARLGLMGSMKTVSSSRIKQPVISGVAEGQAGTSGGIPDASFNALVDRVGALEGQTANAITGVTESGTGNYVVGVTVGSNNKLNVEKTRVLYAPVRNEGSNTIVSDAEIWLIR